MKRYYLMAIEKGCSVEAMCELANYYEIIEHDYDQMRHYYIMSAPK